MFVLGCGLSAASVVFCQDPSTGKPASKGPSAGTEVSEVVSLINRCLAEAWKSKGITPSAPASDYEFIRRATLDIIGRIARPEEIRRFRSDPETTRRALLINRLLGEEDAKAKTRYGEEYARHWARQWTIWLLTRSGSTDEGRRVFHDQLQRWLTTQFADNARWDSIVRELLTATGKTSENGQVNFILTHLGEPIPQSKHEQEGQFEMVPVTARTTRLFLGLQTQCVQCHDHPSHPDLWKQAHFWGMNAFFRQAAREGQPPSGVGGENSMLDLRLLDKEDYNASGIIYYEQRNGRLVSTRPVFLDGTKPELSSGVSRRQVLAGLVIGSDYFAKAYVNRLWGMFFGRGFTHPVDDLGNPDNQPVHPELFEELAARFRASGYDTKKLIRWICTSDAYGLSSVANRSNAKADAEPLFSRMLLKAMSPEQLFDSLLTATQADQRMTEQERDKLHDNWMRNLIVNFGDDEGNEVTFNGTVVQALLMMNGKEINDAILSRERGTVPQAVLRNRGGLGTLNDLYLAALNRLPTAREQQEIQRIRATAPVKAPADSVAFWQDVFWALLNCNEFILNH